MVEIISDIIENMPCAVECPEKKLPTIAERPR
jgi:hypothetical protein